MVKSMVDYALAYAKLGWRVFPVAHKSKTPLIDEWQIQATTDEKIINGWWDTYPTANIGIATGEGSDLFVLDVDIDPEKDIDGRPWLERMVAQKGDLPNTVVQITGRGGSQYLFKYHPGIRNKQGENGITKGVDVRGEGGFVVVPPSIHPNGKRYKWDENHLPSQTPVAAAPEWLTALIELAAKRQAEPANNNGHEPVGKVYSEGGRNGTLTSLGGSMRRRGFEYDAILAALKVENATKCIPPLSDKEVETIAKSVTRYEPTASPTTVERDRATAEWGFAKSVYLSPEQVKEFMWLVPDHFANQKLGQFWAALQKGTDPVVAATDAGVLSELETMTVDVFKIDGYAQIISRFGHLDTVSQYAGKLAQAAANGNTDEVDGVITDITKNVRPTTGNQVISISDVFDKLEAQIKERAKNPTDVWGIPWSPHWGKDRRTKLSWSVLSKLTGGKHKGELTMVAGEPAVGKSWWALQDALLTAISGTPVFIWSGEMGREQVVLRMAGVLGMNTHNAKTGHMTEADWKILDEARAYIQTSPIYINDQSGLPLHELKGLLYRQKMENGIEQFVIDYAYLVNAPGKDDTEKTANVSREMKVICQDLGLAGILIASVTKGGMDGKSNGSDKSDLRGSGQMIHDADNIIKLTKFQEIDNDQVPLRYPGLIGDDLKHVLVTAHFTKGRELASHIPGNVLHFGRMENSPAFREEPQEIDATDVPFIGYRPH